MTSSSPAEESAPVEHATAHHRVHLVGLDGKAGTHQVTLPLAFSQAVRPDLIRRAVVAAQSHRRQPYGTSLTAGLRHSTRWSGKGKGVSRTPRLMDSMRGAQAPNTVGGRPAHPPRVDRIWTKKINRKESRLAFASALAATREVELVSARGHDLPDGLHLPLVLEDPVENILTTKEARALLVRLKLWSDVERAHDGTRLNSGRARRRGRGRRVPRSVLVVTSQPNRALGFRNLSGVEVVTAQRLATEDLAPGGDPARLTLFSHAALESLRTRLKEATA
jgi:large subunit ribosomal protein L4e